MLCMVAAASAERPPVLQYSNALMSRRSNSGVPDNLNSSKPRGMLMDPAKCPAAYSSASRTSMITST